MAHRYDSDYKDDLDNLREEIGIIAESIVFDLSGACVSNMKRVKELLMGLSKKSHRNCSLGSDHECPLGGGSCAAQDCEHKVRSDDGSTR